MTKQIKVIMKDTLNNDKEITRDIDISNFYINGGSSWVVSSDVERQRKMLLDWIEERANEQHNTLLELKAWYIF